MPISMDETTRRIVWLFRKAGTLQSANQSVNRNSDTYCSGSRPANSRVACQRKAKAMMRMALPMPNMTKALLWSGTT